MVRMILNIFGTCLGEDKYLMTVLKFLLLLHARRAVLEGKWVLINNANLCNPTILDRLNSLMELDGSLCLNECGMTDEGFRVISPHPNFRLFLAYDPRYGEVSRAMRNRGIEIYFMPGTVSGLASEVSCQNGRSALIDIINAQGITGWLASRLVASHEEQRIQAIKLHR